MQTRHEKIK